MPPVYVEQARGGTLKAAVLLAPNGQTLLRYFFDDQTLRLARSLIKEAHENATATIYVIFSISFFQAGYSTHYALSNVLEAMRQVFKWSVQPSPLGGQYFQLMLTGLPLSEAARQEVLRDVEKKLLSLSLLYRAGMYIHYVNASTTPEGEPGIGVGPEEAPTSGFRQEHIDRFRQVLDKLSARNAAQGLQAFYRQTTKVGRLALGWMLLEDLFGNTSGYPHILTKIERKAVEAFITDCADIPDEKKSKVIDGFRNTNAFRKSRNEIMAERIALLRGDNCEATERTVKD